MSNTENEENCPTNMVKNWRDEVNDMIKHLRNETIKLFIKTFRTKSIIIRLYLVFLLISVTTITVYTLVGLILSYLKYEVITTSIAITETSSLFPKVTICNYINFQTEYAVEFLSEINNEIDSTVNIFQRDQALNLTYVEINQLANLVYSRAIKKINSKNFTNDQTRRLEHEVTDILFDCQFDNRPCSINGDFVWTYDKTFGNCYVFNSDQNETSKPKMSNIAGNNFGLNIKVYANFHENLTLFHSFTSAKGVILMVENNTIQYDRSLTDGYLRIEPGLTTSVKVDRTFMFELEKPYSTCDIPNGHDSENFFRVSDLYRLFYYSNYQYTQQSCLLQCLQRNLIQVCNCSDPGYLSLYMEKNDCITDAELDCSTRVWENFEWKQCLSDCPLECNQTIYTLTSSSVQFIGDRYVYLIKENKNLTRDFVTRVVTSQIASDSFVELSIFYDTLTYTYVTESPKLDVIALIANIGGNLSLFMGISIFSLFELIEIFIEIYLIKRHNL